MCSSWGSWVSLGEVRGTTEAMPRPSQNSTSLCASWSWMDAGAARTGLGDGREEGARRPRVGVPGPTAATPASTERGLGDRVAAPREGPTVAPTLPPSTEPLSRPCAAPGEGLRRPGGRAAAQADALADGASDAASSASRCACCAAALAAASCAACRAESDTSLGLLLSDTGERGGEGRRGAAAPPAALRATLGRPT